MSLFCRQSAVDGLTHLYQYLLLLWFMNLQILSMEWSDVVVSEAPLNPTPVGVECQRTPLQVLSVR